MPHLGSIVNSENGSMLRILKNGLPYVKLLRAGDLAAEEVGRSETRVPVAVSAPASRCKSDW